MANGWIRVGVAFCSPAPADEAKTQTQLLTNTRWEFPLSVGCDDKAGHRSVFNLWGFYESGSDWTVNEFGGSELAYPVGASTGGYDGCNLGVSGADSGAAGWDVGGNQYFLFYSNGYGTYTMNLFDRADLVSVPVCTVTLTANIDGRYDTVRNVHPFQPLLWSPCMLGTAMRYTP